MLPLHACHVLAAVVTGTLHDSPNAGVAHLDVEVKSQKEPPPNTAPALDNSTDGKTLLLLNA